MFFVLYNALSSFNSASIHYTRSSDNQTLPQHYASSDTRDSQEQDTPREEDYDATIDDHNVSTSTQDSNDGEEAYQQRMQHLSQEFSAFYQKPTYAPPPDYTASPANTNSPPVPRYIKQLCKDNKLNVQEMDNYSPTSVAASVNVTEDTFGSEYYHNIYQNA